jgi:multidrug efflux system membrane fusion protein
MQRPRFLAAGLAVALAAVGLVPGCHPPDSKNKSGDKTAKVEVFQPADTQVVTYLYFTGRVMPMETVEVKARVSGYLVDVTFPAGGLVRGPERPEELIASTMGLLASPGVPAPLLAAAALTPERIWLEGEILFQIDPRPYKAAYDQIASQVELARAKLSLATKVYEMNLQVYNDTKAKAFVGISLQQLATYEASMVEAQASLKAALASLESSWLDLQFTRVRAPIAGKVSRNYLARGNLVTKDQTTLAKINSVDPIYVYFDIEEPLVQDIQKKRKADEIKGLIRVKSPVEFATSRDGDKYPYVGHLDYAEPELNTSTGTRLYRATLANAPTEKDKLELLGGNFVRVRLPLGEPHPATVVPESVLFTEQGGKFAWVVDAQDTIHKRAVETGPTQENHLVVITKGLDARNPEWVVSNGLQECEENGKAAVSKRLKLSLKSGQPE